MAEIVHGWMARAVGLSAAALMSATVAMAGDGQSSPWQMGMQGHATEISERINWLHDFVNVIIIVITLFVLALLVAVVVKFNEKANPTPSRTAHHTGLEVALVGVGVVPIPLVAGRLDGEVGRWERVLRKQQPERGD